MPSQKWRASLGLLGASLLGQLGCADLIELQHRPIDDGTGGTTASHATGTTGQPCDNPEDCISGACVDDKCGAWSQHLGSDEDDHVLDVAIDSGGNVIVAGTRGIGIRKFTPNGAYAWDPILFGGGEKSSVWQIAIDQSDSSAPDTIIVIGHFSDTASIGKCSVSAQSDHDEAFLARISATGQCLGMWNWGHPLGVNGGVYGKAVAVDDKGNIVVAGVKTGGAANLPCGSLPVSANLGMTPFVMKLDPTAALCLGGVAFVQYSDYGAMNLEEPLVLALDPSGNNVFLGGVFRGEVDFGALAHTISNSTGASMFLVKLDESLKTLADWPKQLAIVPPADGYKADGYNAITDITIADDGEIIVVGRIGGASAKEFCGVKATPPTAEGDIFVQKMSKDGGCLWSGMYGGALEEAATSLALDDGGNPVVVGTFASSTVPFDEANAVTKMVKQGEACCSNCDPGGSCGDAFLLRLDGEGIMQKPLAHASNSFELDYFPIVNRSPATLAVAVDKKTGNVVMGGSYRYNVDLGAGPLGTPKGWDGFVVSLGTIP